MVGGVWRCRGERTVLLLLWGNAVAAALGLMQCACMQHMCGGLILCCCCVLCAVCRCSRWTRAAQQQAQQCQPC